MLINKIRKRNEDEAYAELRKLQLLTQVIHTSEPQKLIEELDFSVNCDTSSDLGDLDGLKELKAKRGDA